MDFVRFVTPAEAIDRLKAFSETGTWDEPIYVQDRIDLRETDWLETIPDGFCGCWRLDVSECPNLHTLPDNLYVRSQLLVNRCPKLRELPRGLNTFELEAQETPIGVVPPDLQVEYQLDLSNNAALESLPANLVIGILRLDGCTRLESLPEGVDPFILSMVGCINFTTWPQQGGPNLAQLDLTRCIRLAYIPAWVGELALLTVDDCSALTKIEDGVAVKGAFELADSGLSELPESLWTAELRWRNVRIDARIAFHADEITYKEVLDTTNTELRRVMIDRMGYERFFKEADAKELDKDADTGGIRRLLKIEMRDDEDIVCLNVIDPSTGRSYILRVPPSMQTCRQAAAWIAGFDNPDDYNPIKET